MEFLKDIFEKLDLKKKNQQTTKKACKNSQEANS